MAKSTDLQQALALRKQNPNLTTADAVAQVRKTTVDPTTPIAGVPPAPVTVPPVTPVTPVPTPTAPQVTGVDGQKFTQAPVDPTTGLSKPLEPTVAPVQVEAKAPTPIKTEVASATPKTEPVVDYTQAKGREQDITTNLESFKAQGMTAEQILKASDYANASPEKKAMIEPYLKQIQPTTDSMFNSIVSKADVPDAQKVLPSYKIAQNRYLKANMYASMTPSQVSQEINASRLIEGSRTWEDIKTLNPKLAQDAQNLRIVNGSKSNIFTPVNNPDGTPVKDENGEPVVENNLVKTFTQDYLDDYGDFLREIYKPETMEEINAKIYTPDVKMAQDKASEIEIELNAIEKDINSIEDDIDKEITGSGATGSRARLEKAIRAEKLQNLYNSTLKNYQTYANKANNLITQNTATYQEAYKQNQALQSALASAGGAKFQSDLALAQNQAEFDQKLAQQAQLASDPTTAIGGVLNQFAELGIIADRDLSWHLAEQKRLGMSVPEYTQKMIEDFKKKDQYKAMADAQMRSLAPQQESTNYSFANIGDGRIAVQNPKTGEVTYTSAGSVSSANATTTSSARYLDIPTGTDVGVQCGQFARTLCGMDATPGGNSLDARKKAYIDTAPVAGGMVLFTGSGYDKTYGHIAAIESVNPDGTMNIVESNLKNDNRVTRRTISANDPAIHGFYNDTPLAKSTTGTQGSGYTDADIELFSEIANMDGSAQTTRLKQAGITPQQLAEYTAKAKAGLIPPTESQKQAALGTLSNIQGIAETDWTDAVGKFDYSRVMGLQDAENSRVLIDNVRDAAALNNLGLLKGPMSDKDIAFLKSVSSKLDPVQSNSQFEKNMVEMYNIAARKAGVEEITKLSEIPKERILPGQSSKSTPTTTGAGQTQEYQGYTLKPT